MTSPRPFDYSRDGDLYVDGYSASFVESYPGVAVTESLRASYRDSLANIDSTPGVFAFTIDSPGQDPIAFMVVSLSEGELPRQLSIDVLYVAEGYRCQGLGRRLLNHSQQFATEQGAVFVRLDVSAGNEAALSLYQAAGFAITRFQLALCIAATVSRTNSVSSQWLEMMSTLADGSLDYCPGRRPIFEPSTTSTQTVSGCAFNPACKTLTQASSDFAWWNRRIGPGTPLALATQAGGSTLSRRGPPSLATFMRARAQHWASRSQVERVTCWL